MCKNTILNTAIKATLALPRTVLWTTAAVVTTLSLDAGLAIIGDEVGVLQLGTPAAIAVPGAGQFSNLAANFDVTTINNLVTGGVNGTSTTASATVYSGAAGAVTTTHPLVLANLLGGKYVSATDPGFTSPNDDSAFVYAQELFYGGSPVIPADSSATATDGAYQVVRYLTSGTIKESFDAVFSLSGGATFKEAHLVMAPSVANAPSTPIASLNCGLIAAPTAGGASVTFKVLNGSGNIASCSIEDGTQLYLAYRISGAATSLKAGTPIEMTGALVKTNTTNIYLNIARTIKVAVAKPAAKVEIKPESGSQNYVFISALSNDKEFINNAPAGLVTTTPYVSDSLVKIGYIKVTESKAADLSGKTIFKLGTLAGDKATFDIKDGQFAASKGGVGAVGKVYIDAGSSIIEPSTSPLADDTTASFTLNNTQLTAIANKSLVPDPVTKQLLGAPIMIKVDGATPINIPEAEPSATMTLTLGTTPASTVPVESSVLRRLTRDGKICWVYNIPAPPSETSAVKDWLTIRIINNAKVPTKIVGTLYAQAGGAPIFENTSLLDKLDPSKAEVLVQEGTDYLLAPNSVVRLDAKDIANIAGDDWAGTRRVLKIQANVTDLEVLSMIRNTQNANMQPQSNISTGVTGDSCQ
jgi:hypothetical protein